MAEAQVLRPDILCSDLGLTAKLTKLKAKYRVSNTPNFHFILVHEASHGGWCWFKVRCLMETSGYKVTCLDLKTAGVDPSDPNTVLSFEEYNKPLIDFLFNLLEDEKVILIGYSAGGLSLTDALHKFGSKKIQLAIYVADNMLKYGGINTDEDVKDAVPDLSIYGDVEERTFGLGPDAPPTSSMVKKEHTYLTNILKFNHYIGVVRL